MLKVKTRRTAKMWRCTGLICAMGAFAPLALSGPYSDAHYLLYDGSDPEFYGVYDIGEPYLPPSVRIQPLKATKDAVVASVDTIVQGGLNDRVGAVAFSSVLHWVEPLSPDYQHVRSKLRGTPLGVGSGLALGMQAARTELLSDRARPGAAKAMVLVTDGRSDPSGAVAQAQAAAAAGMTINIVAVGTDADHALLDEIAAIGGGTVTYIDTSTPTWAYAPELEAALVDVASRGSGISLIQ